MRRGARDSQIVNNFFTFATIVIVSITLTIYNKYIVKEKDTPKRLNSELACQQEVNTIDKISNPDLLKHSFTLLSKGHYIIDGGIIPTLDNESILTKKINIKNVTNIYLNSIGINSISTPRFLKIKYELIESEKQSSSAGKLLTSFRLQNKEVFRMSTVFNTYNINEIKKRVLCTMKAFKYNATK